MISFDIEDKVELKKACINKINARIYKFIPIYFFKSNLKIES